MQLSTVNTTTHNIRAWYAFSPAGDGMPIDFMADHLLDIIDELVDYLNGWEEKAGDFELDMNSLPAEPAAEFTLQIVGEVYKENTDTPNYDNETLTVYVTVHAQER